MRREVPHIEMKLYAYLACITSKQPAPAQPSKNPAILIQAITQAARYIHTCIRVMCRCLWLSADDVSILSAYACRCCRGLVVMTSDADTQHRLRWDEDT